MKITFVLIMLATIVAACDQFSEGAEVWGKIRKDPHNKCRVIVVSNQISFTATIDGCK